MRKISKATDQRTSGTAQLSTALACSPEQTTPQHDRNGKDANDGVVCTHGLLAQGRVRVHRCQHWHSGGSIAGRWLCTAHLLLDCETEQSSILTCSKDPYAPSSTSQCQRLSVCSKSAYSRQQATAAGGLQSGPVNCEAARKLNQYIPGAVQTGQPRRMFERCKVHTRSMHALLLLLSSFQKLPARLASFVACYLPYPLRSRFS